MTDTEVFGKGFRDKVRSLVKADNVFLPDSVICADLHIENSRRLIEPIIDLIVKHEIVISPEQIRRIEEVARLYLAGSICMALASRARSEAFAECRDVGWRSKGQSLTFRANVALNALHSEIGGEHVVKQEKTTLKQYGDVGGVRGVHKKRRR